MALSIWLMETDCESVKAGSIPVRHPTPVQEYHRPLAQLVERWFYTPEVVGSEPTGPTKEKE